MKLKGLKEKSNYDSADICQSAAATAGGTADIPLKVRQHLIDEEFFITWETLLNAAQQVRIQFQ